MINFTSKDRYDFADLSASGRGSARTGRLPVGRRADPSFHPAQFPGGSIRSLRGASIWTTLRACREELGDVLLQVLFHTDIERAAGRFDLNDVCDAECKKLIFRHPALFGGEAKSWDEVKQQEKGQTTVTETLDGVARSLPATWRSEKIQKKAAKCGFRWESAEECLDKLDEESAELRQAISNGEDTGGGAWRSAVRRGQCRSLSAKGPGADASPGMRKIYPPFRRNGIGRKAGWPLAGRAVPRGASFSSGPRRRPVRRKALSKLKQRLEKRNCHE